MKKIFLGLFLATLLQYTAYSQTIINGTISSNTSWTKVNSPYVIAGNVVVIAKLAIEAGTIVRFKSNCQLRIASSGNLLINGEKNDTVIFTSDSIKTHVPGEWNQILIDGSSSSVTIKYARIEYASNGINLQDCDAIIKNTQIKDCLNNGIYIYANSNSATIDSCDIQNNLLGIYCYWSAWGINRISISNSIISNNKNIGIYNNTSVVTVDNCSINNNINYGINSSSSGISIYSYNIVQECNIGIYSTTGTSKILNNIIQNNTVGVKVGEYPLRTTINCNKIQNNSSNNLVYQGGVEDGAVDATNNYFGIIDTNLISASIYDIYDDSNLKGSFNFLPFKTSFEKLVITSQPQDTQIYIGLNNKLVVKVNEPNATFKWFKDGSSLIESSNYAGVNKDTLYIKNASLSQEGNYYCVITTTCENISSDTVNIKVKGTSISSVKESTVFYPNPAFNKLNLKNINSLNASIIIFDLQGKQLLNQPVKSSEIDISNLSKGIYIVKLVSSGKILINKLIKE